MNASQRRVSDALDALTAAVEDETLPNGVVWSLGYLRAWMEERIVSERTTGATPEQIEAAAKREWEWTNNGSWHGWDNQGEAFRRNRIGMISRHIEFIVPPDERIVPASAVPTPEQRAAVGRLAERAARNEYMEYVRFDEADIEAARAFAEGGTNDR